MANIGMRSGVWPFNVDGSEFLSGSRDLSIIHRETESGVVLNRLNEHRSGVRALAFNPDGIHAVSGAGDIDTAGGENDYELLYWDLDKAVVLREMAGHTQTIRSLMFNADGTEILSASDDNNVILWHADTLDSLIARISENYQVICVAGVSNDVCEEVAEEDEDNATTSFSTGFPLQTNEAQAYVEDSLCLLPENGNVPVNGIVDTSAFVRDGDYVIGYSNAGVAGTPDDWIAAWAEYEASQLGDSVTLMRFGCRW